VEDEDKMTYLMEGLEASDLYRKAREASEMHWLTTRMGHRVPMVWLRRAKLDDKLRQNEASDQALGRPLVLLHCHGNATDIGMMMGPYYELGKVLGIEVCGVEYAGYGAAEGRPSSGNTYADVEAAYDYLVANGVPPNRIVAYGQSVGSGPATALASKKLLGGVVLHSPLLSGIKVVDPKPDVCCRPSCVWSCFDFYPNDRRIRQLLCPLFVMHGQRDDIIPFYHGFRLHKACPKQHRWPAYFPARAGHNDLVETDMRAYFGEVAHFLQDVRAIAEGNKVEPPTQSFEKPPQVQMVVKSSSETEPRQVEMAETSTSAENQNPCPVKVGPEDGRYEEIRKGHLRVRLDLETNGAQAPARELR